MTHPLRVVDRVVKVPLGFAWLLVIAVLAVPVILYMTALYHVVQAVRGVTRSRRAAGPAAEDEA
jgi:energy-coupling factor transporter transmembrane protein EcfT